VLTADERTTLAGWARRRTTAQALALRARIVLQAADGDSNTRIARRERVVNATVGKWRSRFLEKRLEGLLDEPRPGVPRRITDAEVEGLILTTLESTPRDATHWSTRTMARAVGLSQSRHFADLAGVRLAATPRRDVQAVEGSAVCRQDP
jgi:transposase